MTQIRPLPAAEAIKGEVSFGRKPNTKISLLSLCAPTTPNCHLGASQELQMQTTEHTNIALIFSAFAFYHLELHYLPPRPAGCFPSAYPHQP